MVALLLLASLALLTDPTMNMRPLKHALPVRAVTSPSIVGRALGSRQLPLVSGHPNPHQ